MSKRIYDVNDWPEIKGNPISKVGVFPYSGAQIDPNNELQPPLDPDKIYMVYRSESELSDSKCIDSFKLLPWTDDHAMLGNSDAGLLPAEEKGVQGVVGQEVYFENGYLKANLKIFSEKLAELINNGKKELSIGYRCLYDIKEGVYNGEPYNFIQTDIRGNHLATVEEGRAGPDVSVLDKFKFTLDAAELKNMKQKINAKDVAPDVKVGDADPEKEIKAGDADPEIKTGDTEQEAEAKPATLDEVFSAVKDVMSKMDSYSAASKAAAGDATPEIKAGDADPEKEIKAGDADPEKGKGGAMDAAVIRKSVLVEIAERDALATKLSPIIGTFDHKRMGLNELAEYGVKKLELKVRKGHEITALDAYFEGLKKAAVSKSAFAADSSEATNEAAYYNDLFANKGSK